MKKNYFKWLGLLGFVGFIGFLKMPSQTSIQSVLFATFGFFSFFTWGYLEERQKDELFMYNLNKVRKVERNLYFILNIFILNTLANSTMQRETIVTITSLSLAIIMNISPIILLYLDKATNGDFE